MVIIRANPNLDILGEKFDSKHTFEDHVRAIVSHVSQRMYNLRLVKRIFVDTSVFLRCYFAFVLPIPEYCFPVWRSAADCHLQLRMSYKVNLNSNHCLFSELTSASTRVRHTRTAAAAHPLDFEVSRRRMSQFARSFQQAQVRI